MLNTAFVTTTSPGPFEPMIVRSVAVDVVLTSPPLTSTLAVARIRQPFGCRPSPVLAVLLVVYQLYFERLLGLVRLSWIQALSRLVFLTHARDPFSPATARRTLPSSRGFPP